MILGSLLVTAGAAVISIPIGVACAVYIAEIAPLKIKEVLKAGIELLAAIPSVVLGFIGMVTLVPLVKNISVSFPNLQLYLIAFFYYP